MLIILLGYMGSGKSVVGKALADRLQNNFIDLDHYIEVQQNTSISALFKDSGPIQFRKIEAKAVREICSNHNYTVLAAGGGTPCYGDTMQFLIGHPNIITIYLRASVETLNERLIKEKSQRPLIADIADEKLSEYIAKHLFERTKFYRQSQLTINTDSMNLNQIVDAIKIELN
ncbi:MAG: shikimate kinase [Bacteroidota bacterium]|nr:shikimate kinase [Bacteroidota bacterium]